MNFIKIYGSFINLAQVKRFSVLEETRHDGGKYSKITVEYLDSTLHYFTATAPVEEVQSRLEYTINNFKSTSCQSLFED